MNDQDYDRLNRYVDDLLADHSPEPFPTDSEMRDVLKMAAQLRTLKTGADQPRHRFIRSLTRRIMRSIAPRPGVSRRRVVIGAAGGLVAGLLAGVGVATGGRRLPALSGMRSAPQPGWVLAGRLADVPQAGALAFASDSLSGYVMRNGEQLWALSAICNHRGCHVHWMPAADRFVCPCDGAEFSQKGESLEAADEYSGSLQPLSRLAVQVQDGSVYVRPA